ncbi:hypothetical protein OHA98_19075 [Streptomyces sp. NBC_00654]|nr:hypothetical protein [Streptomyces sp. NBC_00654]MCX4966899.1 hypothetical protein [Streptomyces sp. NBC_00654]
MTSRHALIAALSLMTLVACSPSAEELGTDHHKLSHVQTMIGCIRTRLG